MPEFFATETATHNFFQKHNVHLQKQRRLNQLTVSALGHGTYLGASDTATDRLYEEAFVHAGLNGINFFDTALNYRCQRSERNLAYAIRKLASFGIFRDQLVIATKGGFLPADADPNGYQDYILKCFLNTGILTPDDIVAHCHAMTPKFLDTTITMSLNNLKLKCIDLYYLHNPEIQLPVIGETQFYAQLTKAFALFEDKVAEGKIKTYGIATWNGFRNPVGQADLLNINKIMKCAKDVAGDKHHFTAIQLPLNVAMLEAVAIQNQKIHDEDFPILPSAVHHGLHVMISAPLMQGHALKLNPSLLEDIQQHKTLAQKCLEFVTSCPGVVTALAGMKTKDHVDDNRHILSFPNVSVSTLQTLVKKIVR